MSDLSDIRDGLKTVLEAANSKLRVYPRPPDEGVQNKPGLVLRHGPIDYHEMAMGGDSLRFDLKAVLYLYGANSDEMWNEIDKYRSPTGTESIKRGLNTDDTLNGKADVAVLVSSDEGEVNRDGTGIWEYSCMLTFSIIQSN